MCVKKTEDCSVLISIIIPTRNRPAELVRCLAGVCALEFDHSLFEVIVVDDGSELPLEDLTNRFKERLPLKWHRQWRRGPAAARNAGARLACARFLAFLDDDCVPAADWLTAMARRLTQHPDRMVGGRVINALPRNACAEASQQQLHWIYKYYDEHLTSTRFFASCNLTVPATQFDQIGGFDTTYPLAAAEDRDFCDRWRLAGMDMVYAPEMIVHHHHGMSFGQFWKQHMNYGRGAFQFHRNHYRRTHHLFRLQALTFYVGMLLSPFEGNVQPHPYRVAGLLVMSQAAHLSGYLTEILCQVAAQRWSQKLARMRTSSKIQ